MQTSFSSCSAFCVAFLPLISVWSERGWEKGRKKEGGVVGKGTERERGKERQRDRNRVKESNWNNLEASCFSVSNMY